MIEENFLHINKKETFDSLKDEIKDDSLTFINETGTLYHHGKEFLQPTSLVIGKPKPKTNGYDYVDMGEAGIWATCNIGANSPEEYGLYFAWGETTGYANASDKEGGFTWETAPYWVSGSDLSTKWSKYTTTNGYSSDGIADNKTILELEDDAAHVNMGGDWRIPTPTDFTKLCNACNSIWLTSYNGKNVNGKLYTLKSDSSKQLFFPAAGLSDNSSMDRVGSYGEYHSRNLNTINYKSSSFRFHSSGNFSTTSNNRYYGTQVRAILNTE